MSQTITSSDKRVQYVGRGEEGHGEYFRYSFPGTTIRATVSSKTVDVVIEEYYKNNPTYVNYYTVAIDGHDGGILKTEGAKKIYRLPIPATKAKRLIELRKRTESFEGESRFFGFVLDADGKAYKPPALPKRKLEFIGDSITCGFGVMVSANPPKMDFSLENENHDLSFATLTAQQLAAQEITVAWSGRGVFRSYDGKTEEQLPAIYPRAIGSDPNSKWDFAQYQPDAVVINLGTNDFSEHTKEPLKDADYLGAYEGLLRTIRSHYPKAHIFCCVGPALDANRADEPLPRARRGLQGLAAKFAAEGDTKVHFHEFPPHRPPYGESYHPSMTTHRQMADSLAEHIRKDLNW